MSSIPTKQIDGDVAIGRDANVGGNATVRGSLKVGHNLTVEGWLDAKNIKVRTKACSRRRHSYARHTPIRMKGGGHW